MNSDGHEKGMPAWVLVAMATFILGWTALLFLIVQKVLG